MGMPAYFTRIQKPILSFLPTDGTSYLGRDSTLTDGNAVSYGFLSDPDVAPSLSFIPAVNDRFLRCQNRCLMSALSVLASEVLLLL